MKIKLVNSEGKEWWMDVVSDFSLDKLRMMAVSHFNPHLLPENAPALPPGPGAGSHHGGSHVGGTHGGSHGGTHSAPSSSSSWLLRAVLNFRLLHVRTGDVLIEEGSVADAGIHDGDEIMLVSKRKAPPSSLEAVQKFLFQQKVKEGPTRDEINEATGELPSPSPQKSQTDVIDATQFQQDLKSILITLIESIVRILCLDSSADEVFSPLEEKVEEIPKSEPENVVVDEASVKILTDMGFTRERSVIALTVTRNRTFEAMDWLLYHENRSNEELAKTPVVRTPTREDSAATADDCLTTAERRSKRTVTSLLHSYRALRRKKFKPNEHAMQHLLDMGFSSSEIQEALLATGNNESSACDWLLGERKTDHDLLPGDEGLNPNSPIYKGIMSNCVVQLYLSNPRNLNALLGMLDNPTNASSWVSDADAGPMLLQISRIYHAEKSSLVGKTGPILGSPGLP